MLKPLDVLPLRQHPAGRLLTDEQVVTQADSQLAGVGPMIGVCVVVFDRQADAARCLELYGEHWPGLALHPDLNGYGVSFTLPDP